MNDPMPISRQAASRYQRAQRTMITHDCQRFNKSVVAAACNGKPLGAAVTSITKCRRQPDMAAQLKLRSHEVGNLCVVWLHAEKKDVSALFSGRRQPTRRSSGSLCGETNADLSALCGIIFNSLGARFPEPPLVVKIEIRQGQLEPLPWRPRLHRELSWCCRVSDSECVYLDTRRNRFHPPTHYSKCFM